MKYEWFCGRIAEYYGWLGREWESGVGHGQWWSMSVGEVHSGNPGMYGLLSTFSDRSCPIVQTCSANYIRIKDLYHSILTIQTN